jgi:transcriptional regulator with XRE-family HTH domain
MAKKKPADDAVMSRVRALFEKSGLTLHDLGLRMGYDPDIARKSAWQFMKTEDPRVSMLRKFAAAVGIDVKELV